MVYCSIGGSIVGELQSEVQGMLYTGEGSALPGCVRSIFSTNKSVSPRIIGVKRDNLYFDQFWSVVLGSDWEFIVSQVAACS